MYKDFIKKWVSLLTQNIIFLSETIGILKGTGCYQVAYRMRTGCRIWLPVPKQEAPSLQPFRNKASEKDLLITSLLNLFNR